MLLYAGTHTREVLVGQHFFQASGGSGLWPLFDLGHLLASFPRLQRLHLPPHKASIVGRCTSAVAWRLAQGCPHLQHIEGLQVPGLALDLRHVLASLGRLPALRHLAASFYWPGRAHPCCPDHLSALAPPRGLNQLALDLENMPSV